MRTNKNELREKYKENRHLLEKAKKEIARLVKDNEKEGKGCSDSIKTAVRIIEESRDVVEDQKKVIRELVWSGESEQKLTTEFDVFELVKEGNCNSLALAVMEGYSIELRDKDRWTPMHIAALNGHAGIVEFLARLGADINSENADKATPLHVASGHSQYAVTEKLLHLGANPMMRTKEGRTPLSVALDPSISSIIREYEQNFIKTRLDKLHQFKDLCNSILRYAVVQEYHDLLPLLAAEHENGQDIGVNCADEHGDTALHIAVRKEDKTALEHIFTCKPYPFVRNKNSEYPMDIAETEKIKKILKEYEESYIRYICGNNAAIRQVGGELLLYCCVKGHSGAVGILIPHAESGLFNINIADADENTALHLAVKYQHNDIAALLLKHGAEMLVTNKLLDMPSDYIGDNKKLERIFNNYERIWVSKTLNNYYAMLRRFAEEEAKRSTKPS